ncbi:MAG: hypothetical protein K0R69_3227, partial [Clostridia bacterium]|nr:hypothetical protein [Clostridia bacterium]
NEMERVLRDKYIGQQNRKMTFSSIQDQEVIHEKKIDRERHEALSEGLQKETPEEINYLEEIEKKLKDIQARLKVSNVLEQNIRKFQTRETLSSEEQKKEQITQSAPTQEFVNKMADFKKSMQSQTAPAQEESDGDKVSALYNSAPRIQPFEYREDQTEWVRISLSDLMTVPSLSKEWCTQPFVTFSYYKYNEIILGKDKKLNKYYVGIPDIYHPERKNILQADVKIEKFMCARRAQPTIGEYGYWLIEVSS